MCLALRRVGDSCEGGDGYLVGDRWHYPRADRWVLVRSEPPRLYRHRMSSRPGQQGVNVAPPAAERVPRS